MSTSPIKILRRYTAQIKSMLRGGGDAQEQEGLLSLLAEYNSKNLLIAEQKYDADGELEELHSYTYDANGHLTEHVMELPQDGINERFITTRNGDGLPMSIVKFYGDDPGEKVEYTYGTHSHPVEIVRYDADGEFESKELLSYDDQSRLVERKIESPSEGNKRFAFTYSEKGLITREEEFDAAGSLVSKLEYEYDMQDREVSLAKWNKDGKVVSMLRSEYNELGRLVRRVSKGFYTRITMYEYDELGRLLEEALSDENGFVISRNRMEYDEHGNVLEETVYETDLTRAGRDTHLAHRFEYEFF